MKKIKYIFSILIVTSLFTSSCDLTGPIDEIKPSYKLTGETLFTDSQKVEAVMQGIYATFKSWDYGYANAFIQARSFCYKSNWSNSISTAYLNNEITPSTTYLDNYYRALYAGISRANYLIQGLDTDEEIPGLTDERKTILIAEARIHRAIFNLMLLRDFGQFYDLSSTYGIVLFESPISEIKDYPRNTVQECYDLILTDLDFGIANASDSNPGFYYSKNTAKAFKAKVSLYMGNWAQAASLASEIINSGAYTFASSYSDIFNAGFDGAEVIFSPSSIAPNYTSSPGTDYNVYNSLLFDIADQAYPGDGDIVTGDGLDPRFAYAQALNNLPYGTYNNKYHFSYVVGEKYNSHYVMRLAELYLIFAEAKTRTESTVSADAISYLNIIRERAGYGADYFDATSLTKAELLEAIRVEKVLELFGEFSQEWYDLVRYHTLGDVDASDVKATINHVDKFILPIPVAALSGNAGLVQNPGY